MKRIRLAAVMFLVLAAAAWSDAGAAYYSLSDFLSRNFADPNSGLTVFPTLRVPMGGRCEGMGTAYTAVALDSGYLEANPAASSVMERGELSFLHHSWIADSNLEAIVYTVRFRNLGIGVGGKFLYVPFTEFNDWGARAARGYFSESIATLNISYNFFPSYAFYGLAAGVNLKAAYRGVPSSIYPDQSALAAMADFGLLTRFNLLKFYTARDKNFSVGLALKNLGPPVLNEPLPTVATAGIAYSPLRPLIWALDFNLPISFDPRSAPAERWYFATGANLAVTRFLDLQGGLQLKADNPRVSLGAAVDLEKVSFILNYNLDLSGRLNPLDKFSIEAKLNLGDRGRLAKRSQIDELYLNGLQAYAQGELQRAIEFWEQALALDPGFQPARRNIETSRKALELQNRVFEETQAEPR